MDAVATPPASVVDAAAATVTAALAVVTDIFGAFLAKSCFRDLANKFKNLQEERGWTYTEEK